MAAALEGGSPTAPAAGSAAAGGEGGLAHGSLSLLLLLLLLLSSSLPMGEPAPVGVETPDCGLPSLGEFCGVQAFPRPSPSGDCACSACCSMKSSMNHLTLSLYCLTVSSEPSNQGGYLRLYLLHNFFNCCLTAALNPFFSYLFSGCSLLSIWLTISNASISWSDGGPFLLGLGGVGGLLGGLGRSVLALPPPQPMSSLSGMFGSLGLLQATRAGAPPPLGLLNLVTGGVTGWLQGLGTKTGGGGS